MKLLLPAQINPPRFRKDGSVSLSFDSRELSADEVHFILGERNSEGWILYAPNQDEIDIEDIPQERANIDLKSASERLRSVIFIWYKQETEKGSFVGLFDTFYKEKMERIIDGVKTKLND